MKIDCGHYPLMGGFDELLEAPGKPRDGAGGLCEYFAGLAPEELEARHRAVDASIMAAGITFTVYSEAGNIDRAWPFDVVPRIIEKTEWDQIEAGLKQRLQALNRFIDDIYHEQKIIADGVFPAEVMADSKNFREACVGANPPFGVWANICGTDLVRDGDGTVYVLEDNLRVPSGVSYMLENRQLMKRLFPELFARYDVLPVDDYTAQLSDMLTALSPRQGERPEIAVLTPGIFNSAYFEHSCRWARTWSKAPTWWCSTTTAST